jgi:hypothetical protein
MAHPEERPAGTRSADSTDAPEDYSEHLRVVRRRQALVFIAFFAFIPVMLIVEKQELPMPGSFFVYGAVFMALGARMGHTRCARCGNRVFYRGWFGNAFSPKCMNCGLDHWA